MDIKHDKLPPLFFDGHHHFVHTTEPFATTFHKFLSTLLPPNTRYLPHDYFRDVIHPLTTSTKVCGSIHMEAIPTDGLGEAQWVSKFMNRSSLPSASSSSSAASASSSASSESLSSHVCRVKGIVASCHLASPDVEQQLQHLVDPKNFYDDVDMDVHEHGMIQKGKFINNETTEKNQQKKSPVVGVRWIVDCVGKYTGVDATHIATTRWGLDGVDYLRGSGVDGDGDGDANSKTTTTAPPSSLKATTTTTATSTTTTTIKQSTLRYDGGVIPEFEHGFMLLERYGLTFDLQCAPSQLLNASQLCRRHPNVKVVIDHMGKPRNIVVKHHRSFPSEGDDSNIDANKSRASLADDVPIELDQAELNVWREGMKAMATSHSNVYCKISMLGYIIPGWIQSQRTIDIMKSLVLETVQLFGPKRCMVCTNYWNDDATSDSDGLSNVGPTPVQFLSLLYDWLKDYSEDDLHYIFCKTAMTFYGIDDDDDKMTSTA